MNHFSQIVRLLLGSRSKLRMKTFKECRRRKRRSLSMSMTSLNSIESQASSIESFDNYVNERLEMEDKYPFEPRW